MLALGNGSRVWWSLLLWRSLSRGLTTICQECSDGISCLAGGWTRWPLWNCVASEKCNKNETENYAGIKYTTTYYCCEGDFCNSAATLPTSHLSLPMALAMLGVWLVRLL
uniref:UPAR/Ly6 domain-containing protein n=1 Tax=Podarcis muralis TaxID=64176 RepID=A0A670HUF0_PODMU